MADRLQQPVGSSPLIAFIVGLKQLAWKPSTVLMLDAISGAVEAQGAGLMLVVDAEKPSHALRNLIGDGLVSGVLVRAQAADQPWVRELAVSIPAVTIGAHRELGRSHVVEIENIESTAMLVGSMLDAGCERLAMVCGPEGRVDAQHRLEGFRLAHVQRGLKSDASLIFPGNYRREGGYAVAERAFAVQSDGIFAANDETARGLLDWAGPRGINVPDDVMIAGFDGTGTAGFERLELASVHTPWDTLAETAVETLLGLVAGMDMPLERLIDPTVRLGSTVLPAARPQDS